MMKRLAIVLSIIGFAFCYAPSPEPSQAQFGTQQLSTSTGSANAQSVPLANYTLRPGIPVSFIVGFGLSNTDATTLNVNGTGAIAFRRATQVGVFEMVGGELVQDAVVTAIYDGSTYRQVGASYVIGERKEFRGPVPQGYQIEDGTCVASAAARYAGLFAAIGTTYSSCGAGTFRVPDSRGRVTAPADAQGGTASGNLTLATNNCNAVIGASCFQPTSVLSISQLPIFTVTGSISAVTPSGTISAVTPSGSVSAVTPSGTISAVTPSGSVSISDTRTWRLNSGVPVAVVTGSTFSAAGGTGFGAGSDVSVVVNGGSISGGFSGSPTTPSFTGSPTTPSFTANPSGGGANIFPYPPMSIVYSAVKL